MILVSILCILLLIVLMISIYGFHFAFVKSKKIKEDTFPIEFKKYVREFVKNGKWLQKQEVTQVKINSFDDLKLNAYYLENKEAKRVVLCAHGYRGNAIQEFSTIARFYYEHDCSVLLIDERACGKSEGKYITFGALERYDIISWLSYLKENVSSTLPIYLDGVSMGASTVLMSSNLGLDTQVHGIIADCGFTSPWDIIKKVMKQTFHVPSFPVLYVMNIMCQWIANFDLKEASTLTALQENEKPVLFVHGNDDHFVPKEMTMKNYEICRSEKQLEIIEGAGHALSYFVEREKCEEGLLKFFDTYDE